MSAPRIGVFGGTFNPVHCGHVRAAEAVRDRFALARVLLVPSFIPPHKDGADVAPAADRMRMVELACAGRPGLEPSAIEVDAGETSYSVVTLSRLRALHPGARLLVVLGVDAFLEIATWREYERVLAESRFIVIARPGWDLARARSVLGGRLAPVTAEAGEAPPADEALDRGRVFLAPVDTPDISSTDVRARVRAGESLAGRVPPEVERYIREHRLYLTPRPGDAHDQTP